jgi:PAS domain S-box-containing protein
MSFWGPDTLGSVAEKIDTILPGLEKVDPNMVEYYHAIRAAIHNLTHETDDRCRLSEAIWLNARKVEKVSREQDDFVTLLLVTTCNLALANWFGEHERAAAIAESGEKFVAGARGFFLDPVFRFHQCLAYCSAYDSADADAQRNYLETIEATVRRFEHLAEHCPSTYLHQANLCKAELARIRSDIVEAMNLYDEAIASARAGGFVQNDALANEMAARFWSSLNMDKISRLYFTEAAYRYRHWGASQKVAMLENRYGTDLSTSTLVSQSVAGTEAVATAMAPVDEKGLDLSSDSLDLASVAKAMRAICSEIDLGKVLSQIMKVTIENAGAERGVLLLEDGGELQVAATGPHELGSAESSTAISAAIVNYVRRTGERVVLDDATLDDRFRMDPHVIEHRPRSILCLPVVKQTRAIGILYLENNLVTHALTTQRLQALEILAAQAAIAVENARVYEALRVEVIERERRERRFRDLLESAPDATVIVNLNGEIVLANTQAEKIFGYKQSELLGQQIEMLVPDRFKDHELQRERLIDGIDVQPIDMAFESWGLHKDGREFPAEISLGPIDTDDGLVVSASIRDITDRKQLEEQLQQSQKMEAVGQLSGGIAHDFNNILSGILGFAELMKAEIPETGSLRDYTDEIISCSLRAADLTKQLLAFSRKQVVQPKLVDVNEALTSFQGILRRVIREDVELTMTLGEGATTVRIDPGQLEQVVMNLVINARDAIHQAGEIHIRTSLFELIESAHSPVDAMLSGRYLRLEVADSGCGMTPEIQARIFEPFYTTKEMGSGTGLGLATVFGIVQQAHGFIEVDSNAGEGSMFAVYLPWREGEVESLQSVSSAGTPAKRSGTILLVEDDDTLRRYATAALTSSGYQVLPTDGAEEAIALIDRYPNRIDLLLTDVVMPHMSGGELAEYLSEQRPTMKVLFMSGYSEDALVEHRISGEGASLLHKPFTPQQLENAIQEALREPR